MRKSKKFIGMPVISLAEGQQMGTVKGLVVDPQQQKVAALIIEQKGWFSEQKFAPYGKVRSVGSDAITIDQSAAIEKGSSLPEILKLYKDKVTVVGCKVVAENGCQLGEVDEYYVEETNGSIVGLEISANLLNSIIKGKSFLDISFVKTIGKQLVVTSNHAMENLVKIDGGLSETVKHIKDSTSYLWESTLQKTKELGSKTKDELESKTKELTDLTKDLGESLLEKVKGKHKEDAAEQKETAPVTAGQTVESDQPPAAAPPTEEDFSRSADPVADQVTVADLPPEALLREAPPVDEPAINGQTEEPAEDPSAAAVPKENPPAAGDADK
ncbi:PRC-barrel domain-containing protein [Desulfotomaculum varum]